MQRIRFTQEGYDKLKEEYQTLLSQRPAVVEDLKKAREMGDLKENGYYKASRAKLSFIDSRLNQFKLALKHAIIVDNASSNAIGIGSIVTLTNGKKEVTYHIAGDLESNPSEGKISLLSPIGQAIANKHMNEEVEVDTPNGKMHYKIIRIS